MQKKQLKGKKNAEFLSMAILEDKEKSDKQDID